MSSRIETLRCHKQGHGCKTRAEQWHKVAASLSITTHGAGCTLSSLQKTHCSWCWTAVQNIVTLTQLLFSVFFFPSGASLRKEKGQAVLLYGLYSYGMLLLKECSCMAVRQAITPTRICVCSLWVARLYSLKTPKNPNLTDKLPAGMWLFHTLSFLALHKHQNFIPLSRCHIHF